MRHRGCEVHIQCEDEQLEEHNIRVQNNVIECHIASTAGKVGDCSALCYSAYLCSFAVRKALRIMCSKQSNAALTLKISIDGQDFPTNYTKRARKNDELVWKDDAGNIRPLMFREIIVTGQIDHCHGEGYSSDR